jgi:cardiolipin synthase
VRSELKASTFKKNVLGRGILALLFLLLFVFFLYKAVTPELPTASHPCVFYATPCRQDLKLTLSEAIRSAKHSIFASFYGVTDREIIATLAQKAHSGVAVSIEYDRTASSSFKGHFPPTASIYPRRSKGLMHRKILVIDQAKVFIGSANLTPSSLRHHSNFMIGLYSTPFARFLSNPPVNYFSLEVLNAEMWLLPDTEQQALKRLLQLIQSATTSIQIAMFTLTHPQIVEALDAAMQRGVKVSLIVDFYSARGASKKSVDMLQKMGARIHLSQGPELFHHKWAIIDASVFAMGSANWTKAAFTKNEDFLFILSSLTNDQKKYLADLWEILELEANDATLIE